jgi:signal transduction histidine kinase
MRLSTTANIVATTIQRQAFEKDILEISEHEQCRIGQDLHDDLCQRLAGIALTCDLLQQSLAATSIAESVAAAKIGFPGSPEPRAGMGLRIMKYRAEMIGANLDVRQNDLRGTIVTCQAETAP